MQKLCNATDSLISLSELSENKPFIFYIEPFVGELNLQIDLSSDPIKGVCYYVNSEKPSFTIPYYFSDLKKLPSNTQLVIFKLAGSYIVVFTLSHRDLLSSIFCHEQRLYLKTISGLSRQANKRRAALVALKDTNLYSLIKRCMNIALHETGQNGKMLCEKGQLPPGFHRLGWHSELAFGQDISHDKVLKAVKSLKQVGIVPGFILIDEGWQQLDPSHPHESLYEFEADRKKFPYGLKGLIQNLQEEGISQIGVWHAVMGYRGGVHSKLAKYYELPPDEKGRYFLGYDLGRSFQFFHDYYGYLKEQGVTFVKVGDQENISSFCRQGMDLTRLHKNLQTSIQAASSLHFQTAQFNTDCLKNENLFYWTTSQVAQSAKQIEQFEIRLIADFIRNSLVNSLWLQHWMQIDTGSWISHASYSETMAIFHALSGTFTAISDSPDAHDQNLLKKIVLPSGFHLKTDHPLTLCEDSIFVDPLHEEKIYKAFTYKANWAIIAAFNFCSGKRSLIEQISPSVLPDIIGNSFVAFSYRLGYLGVVNISESIRLKLKPQQSDIITFAPIHSGIAVIGCHLFFLAPGIITEVTIEDDSVHITSMIAAPILIYCERKVLEIRRNGQVIPWSHDIKCNIVSIDSRDNIVETIAHYTITFEA